MIHKIVIKIGSEKEWAAACALSSTLNKPVSEIAKNDFIDNLTLIAQKIKKDKNLYKIVEERNPGNIEKILGILN